ncbi:MAG: carboxypeptidase regulatory-like domain-containing protein, partial [Cytophagia bacterium]|nr:carboxypeptidase regulatory-like domain-containing protein [Cytophagia bacterium]
MKKKLLIVLLLLISIYTQTLSQVTVTGKVTDQLKTPIPGATIAWRAQDKQEGTTTSADGLFKFELVKPGVYDLEIRFLGF